MKRKIFVFGSNTLGRHGKGAALEAKKNWGAIYGQLYGIQGDSFAIPTKNGKTFKALKLTTINIFVNGFIAFARRHPNWDFLVTAIGTGLAGYKHTDIAPMFKDAPSNCILPEEWKCLLSNVTPKD